jgi:hypothetical protein
MLIEDALCDAVRAFHMDALSSAVGLRVDVDVAVAAVTAPNPRRIPFRGNSG